MSGLRNAFAAEMRAHSRSWFPPIAYLRRVRVEAGSDEMLPEGPASADEREAGFIDAAIPNPDGPSLSRPFYLKAVIAKFGQYWVIKARNPESGEISYLVWSEDGWPAQPSACCVAEVTRRFRRLRLVPRPPLD